MKKMLILMNYLFGIIGIIYAQVIEGNITDLTSHQPIEGVTVCLTPVNIYAANDRAGHFIFGTPIAARVSFSLFFK
jgi:hypothetical protein